MNPATPPLDDAAHGAPAHAPPATIGGVLEALVFHYGRFLGNGSRALREVRAALEATPDERVLDLGCGTGHFCQAVPGDYLGIDLHPGYVAFARWRWGTPRRRFEVVNLVDLEGTPFECAIMVNCLHHLSDDDARAVFQRLARLVRRRLVVVDADLEASNRLQRFLLDHDRGDYVRPVPAQRRLLEPSFRVTAERSFPNSIHTLIQNLFVCEPRP